MTDEALFRAYTLIELTMYYECKDLIRQFRVSDCDLYNNLLILPNGDEWYILEKRIEDVEPESEYYKFDFDRVVEYRGKEYFCYLTKHATIHRRLNKRMKSSNE
jgi:hypothetical protein